LEKVKGNKKILLNEKGFYKKVCLKDCFKNEKEGKGQTIIRFKMLYKGSE
jgi:hypothetical protein